MSAQHTPGPWRAGKVKDAVVADLPVDGVQGSDETDWYGGHLVAESIAAHNRPLIIAGPEMLEVLYQYVSDLRYPPQGDSVQRRIERAEAVIAKATGGVA